MTLPAQPKVTSLVHTCDQYTLQYKGFAFFLAKYWHAEAPCTCYFATEGKTTRLPGFHNIQSGRYEAYALRLDHNYRNQLTHDGKGKSRKEDVFTKLKKWVGKQLSI
jgi:hypothetical protein